MGFSHLSLIHFRHREKDIEDYAAVLSAMNPSMKITAHSYWEDDDLADIVCKLERQREGVIPSTGPTMVLFINCILDNTEQYCGYYFNQLIMNGDFLDVSTVIIDLDLISMPEIVANQIDRVFLFRDRDSDKIKSIYDRWFSDLGFNQSTFERVYQQILRSHSCIAIDHTIPGNTKKISCIKHYDLSL
jgi:hypothetical protein